jgi:antitoxin component of MazEF toxin-antitoxin module
MATKKVVNPPSNPRGIRWSAPVLVRKEGAVLVVTVPQAVVTALALTARDVLNFTELPGGSIEVWKVAKSTYASIDAMSAKSAKKKAVKKAKKS